MLTIEARTESVPALPMQPRLQTSGSLQQFVMEAGVSPRSECCRDEASRVILRAWRVVACEAVLEGQLAAHQNDHHI